MRAQKLTGVLVVVLVSASGAAYSDEHDVSKAAVNRAQTYSQKGQYEDAIFAYRQAAESDPGNLKIIDAMVAECVLWLKVNPLAPDAHIALGRALQLKRDFQGAEAEYKAALRLSVGKRNPVAERLMSDLPHQSDLANLGAPIGSDEQRFAVEKARRTQLAISLYCAMVKSVLEKTWKPPAHSVLLTTRVDLVLNQAGKISSIEVSKASGSVDEDKSILECLRSTALPPLPQRMDKLETYLTLMSDGSMNMVEVRSAPCVVPDYRIPSTASSAPSEPNDVDFGPYMIQLQRRIKRAWFPPKGNESKRVSVQFNVDRNGALSLLRLDKSSGLAVADQAALAAIENAAPFDPLPKGSKPSISVQFTFDWNVFSGGGHGTLRSL